MAAGGVAVEFLLGDDAAFKADVYEFAGLVVVVNPNFEKILDEWLLLKGLADTELFFVH